MSLNGIVNICVQRSNGRRSQLFLLPLQLVGTCWYFSSAIAWVFIWVLSILAYEPGCGAGVISIIYVPMPAHPRVTFPTHAPYHMSLRRETLVENRRKSKYMLDVGATVKTLEVELSLL